MMATPAPPGDGFDALAALRAAGVPIDYLTDGQRDVLAALTKPEADLVSALLLRLLPAHAEVEGQELNVFL